MTLNCYKFQIFTEFCASSHFWEATTAKRMKIDPYYQRQKYSPMTLVSGNIRRMRIFAGVPVGGGVKWQLGCRRRQFWRLGTGWLILRKRKTSNIKWWHATPCRPVIDCKMNDLEWPWVPIICQNPFSTSKAFARLPLHWLGFLVL